VEDITANMEGKKAHREHGEEAKKRNSYGKTILAWDNEEETGEAANLAASQPDLNSLVKHSWPVQKAVAQPEASQKGSAWPA